MGLVGLLLGRVLGAALTALVGYARVDHRYPGGDRGHSWRFDRGGPIGPNGPYGR